MPRSTDMAAEVALGSHEDLEGRRTVLGGQGRRDGGENERQERSWHVGPYICFK